MASVARIREKNRSFRLLMVSIILSINEIMGCLPSDCCFRFPSVQWKFQNQLFRQSSRNCVIFAIVSHHVRLELILITSRFRCCFGRFTRKESAKTADDTGIPNATKLLDRANEREEKERALSLGPGRDWNSDIALRQRLGRLGAAAGTPKAQPNQRNQGPRELSARAPYF
jgi:hypothetical protein